MNFKSWGEFYNQETSLKSFLGNFYSHEYFQEIINRNPRKILEIGSGTGVMSIFLSHLGYDVTSIDNSNDVLKLAAENQKKFNGNVNFIFADGFNLPFEDNSFGICTHQGLFEHFNNEDIKKLTDEQLRVCTKAVIISVPNKNYPEKDVGNERLISSKAWLKLFKDFYPNKKISIKEYQFLLRRNKPLKTIFNLISNKKVQTMIIIEK